MSIAFICPKCATITGADHNKREICRHCNIQRIETEYDLVDSIINNKLEEIKQKYAYSNPLYDPELADRIEKESRAFVRSVNPHYAQGQNIPKCPICQSTNLSKITLTKKAVKIGLFGIFGMGDNGKTWKCNNCGSKF